MALKREVEAGAAIGFGHLRAEQPGRADLLPRFALDDPVALMIVEPRLDDVVENAADRVAKGVVVVGEQRAVGGFDHRTCFLKVTNVSRCGAISCDL